MLLATHIMEPSATPTASEQSDSAILVRRDQFISGSDIRELLHGVLDLRKPTLRAGDLQERLLFSATKTVRSSGELHDKADCWSSLIAS
jgi:hypothetical protein